MSERPDGNRQSPDRSPITRALLITLVIVAGVIVYAFAFQKTDIELTAVKDPGRRESLVRIVRGLVRPNVIEYEQTETFVVVDVAVPCPAGGFSPSPTDSSGAAIVMDPPCAPPSTEVTVRGFGFTPGTQAPLSFIPPSGVKLKLADVEAGVDGTFEVQVTLPDRPDEAIQQLRVTTKVRSGGWTFTTTARETWDKIIETVMLALVATTLGTAVAVPLSFFSARNLMRTIRTPLMSVSLFLVGLPAGIVLGRQFGRWVTSVAGHVTDRPLWLLLGLLASMALTFGLMRLALPEEEAEPPEPWLRVTRIVALLAAGVGVLFAVEFLGYLLIQIGDALEDPLGWFGFLAAFLRNIGDILSTFLTAVAAIVTGFIAAIFAGRLGHTLRDHLPRPAVRTIRYPVGALAIGTLGYLLGAAVNWMYNYRQENPAIAMSVGALMMCLVGGSLAGWAMRPIRERVPGPPGSFLGFVALLAGIVLGGLAGILLGKGADLVVDALGGGRGTVLAGGLVGAVLGLGLAWSTRHLDSLPSGLIAYYLSRSLFNAIRSVEPLVMAIVFVVWVGVGPFAGALALSLHTTAALAKLYSEQVESIMSGPIEAVTATGATRLQTIIYAVVPQIVPPYIAFTLYRWDINVRMSTIIGFAGGGGIGFLLQQNINLLQYRDASVQMLAIAIVVASLDFLSARIRERIV